MTDTTVAVVAATVGAISTILVGLSRFTIAKQRNKLLSEREQREFTDRNQQRDADGEISFRRELRDEVQRLHLDSRELQQESRELRTEIHKLQTTNGLLRIEITHLNIRIVELTTLLKQAGISVDETLPPNGPVDQS